MSPIRVFLVVLLAFCGSFAQSQLRMGVQTVGLSDEAQLSAVTNRLLDEKWNAVVVGCRMPADSSYFERRAQDVIDVATPHLAAGQAVLVRPAYGVDGTSAFWKNLAGGQPFDARYYPPPGPNNRLWNEMGRFGALVARKFDDLCRALGVPTNRVMFEGGNEAAFGGVTGMYRYAYTHRFADGKTTKDKMLASFKLYADWKAGIGSYDTWRNSHLVWAPAWTIKADGTPYMMGELPPRFFKMRQAIRMRTSYFSLGFIYILYTFELSGLTGDGLMERNSWAGPEAEAYTRLGNRVHFNYYSGSPVDRAVYEDYNGDGKKEWGRRTLTPDELAQRSFAAILNNVTFLQENPLLSTFTLGKFGITETNFFNNIGTPGSTQDVRDINAALYRQAHVDKLATLPLYFVGVFTAVASDPSAAACPLWRWTNNRLEPVGKEIRAPVLLDLAA